MSSEGHSVVDAIYRSVTEDSGLSELINSLCAMGETIGADEEAELASHVQRALGLIDVVAPRSKPTNLELKETVAARHQATIAVNSKGLIVEANSAARSIYQVLPGHHVEALPLLPHGSEDLSRVVETRLRSGNIPNRDNDLLRMTATEDDRSVVVDISNFPSEDLSERVAIIRTSDVGWPPHLGPIVRDLFDLTRAEVEVLQLIVEGNKVAQIMQRRSSSEATVRKQLANIFAKTGTGSQIECIRTVMGLSMIHDRDEGRELAEQKQGEADEIYLPRSEHIQHFLSPKGIALEYTELGSRGGKPILFLHSHLFGHGWYLDAIEEARRIGFRIISPIRPGFGGSTAPGMEYPRPEHLAEAVSSLMDHIKVTKLSIVCVGQGLVHALALARHRPDLVLGISAASPVLPDAMMPEEACLDRAASVCRSAVPGALELLTTQLVNRLAQAGALEFAQTLLAGNPRDLEWIGRPEVLPMLEWSLRIVRQSKNNAILADLSVGDDWSDWLKDAKAPIRFLIGENDRQAPMSVLRDLAAANEHVCLHTLPDTGALAYLARFGYFLRIARLEFDGAPIPQKYWWPDPKLWAKAMKDS